jgi:hypothetical protein
MLQTIRMKGCVYIAYTNCFKAISKAVALILVLELFKAYALELLFYNF